MFNNACGTIAEMVSYLAYDYEEKLQKGIRIELASVERILHPEVPPRVHLVNVGEKSRYEVYQTGTQDEVVAEAIAEFGKLGYVAKSKHVPTKPNGYPTVSIKVRAKTA